MQQSRLQRNQLQFRSNIMLPPNEKIITIPLRSNNFQNTIRDVGLFSGVFGIKQQERKDSRAPVLFQRINQCKDALHSNRWKKSLISLLYRRVKSQYAYAPLTYCYSKSVQNKEHSSSVTVCVCSGGVVQATVCCAELFPCVICCLTPHMANAPTPTYGPLTIH